MDRAVYSVLCARHTALVTSGFNFVLLKRCPTPALIICFRGVNKIHVLRRSLSTGIVEQSCASDRNMRVSQIVVYTAIRCGYISIGMAAKIVLQGLVNNC